jgi:glycerophosphoryl diester phosphodiesterase
MKFAFTYISLFLVLVACATAKEPAPFHIQAHRGAGSALPENTLESFIWAWKLGVTPESDLRMTKDGTIVCFHDADLKRVAQGIDDSQQRNGVEQLSLAEVQKLDVGSFRGSQFAGQRIPTLESVFAEMTGKPERLLYLDIKKVDLDQLAALVHKHNVEQQVIFTSEHPRLIRDWIKRIPKSMTLLWNRGSEEQLSNKMSDLRKTDFAGITHLQIHVQLIDLDAKEPFMPSRDFLRKLGHELKSRDIVFQVLPTNSSDQRTYEKLLELGVASFATDYPETTLQAVRSFRNHSRPSAAN